jgi:hypothetical protein
MRWDREKEHLYAGRARAFRSPTGGIVQVGDSRDQGLLSDLLRRLGSEIGDRCLGFLDDCRVPRLDAVVLTGGGMMISRLIAALSDHLPRGARLYNLVDANEPRRTLGEVGPARLEERTRQNRRLVTGATAVGGSSVFWD